MHGNDNARPGGPLIRAIACKPAHQDLEVLRVMADTPGARLVGASSGHAVLEPLGLHVPAKLARRLHRCGWIRGVALPLGLEDDRIGRITPHRIGELREAGR
jgi:hypothetical protein